MILLDDCENCPREDDEFCADGVIYGYCEVNECGGACESHGDCDCECHFPEIPTVEPLSS